MEEISIISDKEQEDNQNQIKYQKLFPTFIV
jgi:hypothetical protein